MPLSVNDPFPNFELPDQDGAIVRLADITGQPAIVYFYPKDDTSGCTLEAKAFQDVLPALGNARIWGVSPDNPKSHRRFTDKYDLKFTLLADEDHLLCEACGVWVEKSMYGKKYMGVERTTFLLAPDGRIAQIWNKVKPAGHAEEVLAALQAWGGK
jgi:peroxiredoxin Q/BCP